VAWDTAQVVSLLVGGTGLITAGAAYRKLIFENRDSVVNGFQKIVVEQRTEIDRLVSANARLTADVRQSEIATATRIGEVEASCQKQLDTFRARIRDLETTVLSQAEELQRLRSKTV
jgi:uncharacterized coiled-coil protein SlyX